MGQLAHEYPRLQESGANLVMLSVDSLKRARQLADQTRPTFPVLSDRDVDAAVAYNVFESGIAIATTFLIDQEGIVRWSYVAQKPADRPGLVQLLLEINRLHA